MKRRVLGLLAIAILLSLAGCFRPASDSPPVVVEPIDLPADSGSELPTIPPLALETPTIPAVTIISPATLNPTQSFGQPLQTPTPPEMPTNPAIVGITVIAPTATTGGFITPIVPLGQVTLVLPTATVPGAASPATPSGLITPTALAGTGECTYVVRAGDNLFRIATNNGVTLEQMRAANPDLVGEAPILQPGQALQIPGCVPSGGEAPAVVPTSPAPPTEAAPAPGTTYTVQPGDTLFSIANRFGITSQAIVNANNLTNPDRLSVGQQLIIPAAP